MNLPTEVRAQEGFDVPMTAGSVGKKKAYSSTISWHPPTMVKCVPNSRFNTYCHSWTQLGAVQCDTEGRAHDRLACDQLRVAHAEGRGSQR